MFGVVPRCAPMTVGSIWRTCRRLVEILQEYDTIETGIFTTGGVRYIRGYAGQIGQYKLTLERKTVETLPAAICTAHQTVQYNWCKALGTGLLE